MARLPLVAILRGLPPDDAPAILEVLLAHGFLLIEIPLNSPDPLKSVAAMSELAPAEALIGAGTVLRVEDVAAVAEAGGDLIISPHADVEIIRAAKARGLVCVPGVATPALNCVYSSSIATRRPRAPRSSKRSDFVSHIDS